MSIASPSAPAGAPPAPGAIIFQNTVWLTWPPPLLRTAVRMSSGTADRFANQVLGALALQLGMLLERRVEVVHIRLVMLAVVNLHRLRVDVRLERGEVVGQGGS